MEINNILGFPFLIVRGPILSIGETEKINFNDREVLYERKLIIHDFQDGVVEVKLTGDYVDISREGGIVIEGNEVRIEVEKREDGDFIAKTFY